MSFLSRSSMAVAAGLLFCTNALADGDGKSDPSLLLFGGTDLFSGYNDLRLYGAFGNAGGIWAPAGLDHDSFATKLLANGGIYTYPSGGLHTDVRVTQLSGSVLAGE